MNEVPSRPVPASASATRADNIAILIHLIDTNELGEWLLTTLSGEPQGASESTAPWFPSESLPAAFVWPVDDPPSAYLGELFEDQRFSLLQKSLFKRGLLDAVSRWSRAYPAKTLQLLVQTALEIGETRIAESVASLFMSGAVSWQTRDDEKLAQNLLDRIAGLNASPVVFDALRRLYDGYPHIARRQYAASFLTALSRHDPRNALDYFEQFLKAEADILAYRPNGRYYIANGLFYFAISVTWPRFFALLNTSSLWVNDKVLDYLSLPHVIIPRLLKSDVSPHLRSAFWWRNRTRFPELSFVPIAFSVSGEDSETLTASVDSFALDLEDGPVLTPIPEAGDHMGILNFHLVSTTVDPLERLYAA